MIKDQGETNTEAHQTVSGEISIEEVYQKHREVGIRVPDLVVILNCSLKIAVTRITKDTGGVRQEREKSPGSSGNFSGNMERRQRIYNRYKELYSFYREKGINVLMLSSER